MGVRDEVGVETVDVLNPASDIPTPAQNTVMQANEDYDPASNANKNVHSHFEMQYWVVLKYVYVFFLSLRLNAMRRTRLYTKQVPQPR